MPLRIAILSLHVYSDEEQQNYNLKSPVTPDQPQVKRPPPSLQITSNFLLFYGLSHGITLEKNGVAENIIYSQI